MVVRCPNIYNALKTKALRKTCYTYQIEERYYANIFFELCRDNNDDYFETRQEEFVEAALCEWLDIIKKISLTAHVGDLNNVGHYISAFNRRYGENLGLVDIRKLNP